MKKIGLYLIVLSVPLFSVPSVMASRTELISKSSSGAIGNSGSYHPEVSGTGQYVVFDSTASNLVANDTNGRSDIFLRNRNTNKTIRVSVSSDGIQADGNSYNPAISADGSTIAYWSFASDLVAGDNNGYYDIFIYDTASKKTSRISVSSDGSEGNENSYSPALSGDGRYVAYESVASNLVSDDTNGSRDIFRYDRDTGTTVRVSLNFMNEETTNGYSSTAAISATGRYVAFQSTATFITPCDDNLYSDVFKRDMTDGTISKVSVGTYACEASGSSYLTGISGDGRYVAFNSSASNLLIWSDQDDTNGQNDVFVHDTQELVTERVSVSSNGTEGNSWSGGYGGGLSSDGQYVTFESNATNLAPDDTNNFLDVFAHDRDSRTTSRESVGHYWEQGGAAASDPSISEDGRYITFASQAKYLVPGDTNNSADIFIRDYLWSGPLVRSISPSNGDFHGGTVLIITGENFQPGTQVTIDNSSALNVSVTGSTQITCITPPHALGRVAITVTNPDGQTWVYPTDHPFSGYTYWSFAMPWNFLLL